MRIVFMGTPEIAATVLRGLSADGREIVGALSQPDRPRGRGMVLQPTPVRQAAEELGIPVFQPTTLRDGSFLPVLRELAPDLAVVVAYGKILPPEILGCPRLGCINLHVSLLPRYRGAAPMQRAVMNGDTETGVTVMHMAEGMDTGDIIFAERFPIAPTDTFGDVHDRAASVGTPLLLRAIDAIEAGNAPSIPQDESQATYAPKIEREECRLDFSMSASQLDCRVRGLYPIPLAFTGRPDGRLIKVCVARPTEGRGAPGTVLRLHTEGTGEIVVACGQGALALCRIKPEGKGEMSAADFIRGRGISVGEILG